MLLKLWVGDKNLVNNVINKGVMLVLLQQMRLILKNDIKKVA